MNMEIYEDIVKTEQLMADIKRIDNEEKAAAEKFKEEFDNFPLSDFKHVGQIATPADPGLREAAESELYALEQLALQQLQNDNNNTADKVSHMQDSQQHVEAEHNYHVHMVNCPMYVPYNDEKQMILIPSPTDMSQKDNTKSLYEDIENTEWDSTPYFEDGCHDTETFHYMHYDSSMQVMIQAVYMGNYSPVSTDIKGDSYSLITYDENGTLEGIYDNTYTIPLYVDNGSTVNLMPTWYYNQSKFLHHLPQHDASAETIRTGNGTIQCRFWTDIALNVQGCLIQFKILVCDVQANTGIVISKMALEQLQTWQDYASSTMYIKQTAIPLFATHSSEILPGRKVTIKFMLDRSMCGTEKDTYIEGQGIGWIWSNNSFKPAQLVVCTFVKDHTLITFQNMTNSTQQIQKGACLGILDMRSKNGEMTNFDWEFSTDDEGNLVLYAHTFSNSLDSTRLVKEDPQLQADTCIQVLDHPKEHVSNVPTQEDPYPWLDKEDARCTMTDEEIVRMKIPLNGSILNEAEKERLIEMVMDNREVFSIRDEIGTCPYFEVKLQLREDKPFFVQPYNVCEDLKPVIQKEMDRLEKLGIIKKGLMGYSSPVLLVKRKQQNLYRVVTDFRVLNECLVQVNHAFPIVRDCLEAIGASKCEVMSVLDLRDACHTLPLSKESQKYCGITPYYGCLTYVYLRMGMGMSCSPALWQQFVHIIWEELPNKERYKIIMDDILIFSTKEQHWEDLDNLFKVLIKYGLKISPHKCQLFKRELVYMGLQFIVKDGVPHYTAMKDKCDAIRNMQTPKSVKECRTFCGMVNFLSTFCKNLHELSIPIYELTKKRARFQWTNKHQKAFEEIKKLLVKPPVLRMVSGDGIFRLESDTSRTAVRGTLYQWQDNQWILVGYHSKKLPEPVQNYGVTELELMGLVANIHGFEQKLRHNYFEVIVDHEAIDYLTKSKHQPTTTRLANLLL